MKEITGKSVRKLPYYGGKTTFIRQHQESIRTGYDLPNEAPKTYQTWEEYRQWYQQQKDRSEGIPKDERGLPRQ